jgi:hypothetical protein
MVRICKSEGWRMIMFCLIEINGCGSVKKCKSESLTDWKIGGFR